jgi:HEAT repeat protein
MRFDSNIAAWLPFAGTAVAIVIILVFIFLRRVVRARHFRMRDERAQFIRQNWQKIVSGEIPARRWFFQRLDREIVESVALDRMDIATPEEAARLVDFFRVSGLLDWYKYAARKSHGGRRCDALLTLGRMGAVEATSVLIDALEHRSDGRSLAAMRALGRIGAPAAGAALVRNLKDPAAYPVVVVESALTSCFRHDPEELLVLTLEAADSLRPLLARALADVARSGMPGDFLALTSDPIADVRASAARILAIARPICVVDLLTRLAGDSEWFVRLRSMVALKELADPFTIPVLIQSLSDCNRLVRLRAAIALAAMEGKEQYILPLAMRANDKYALQALISELERSGKISRMVDSLAAGSDPAVERVLLTAVQAGAARFLIDLALLHPNPLVQLRLLGLLARSKHPAVLQCLEQIAGAEAVVDQGTVEGRNGDRNAPTNATTAVPSRSKLNALVALFEEEVSGSPASSIIP